MGWCTIDDYKIITISRLGSLTLLQFAFPGECDPHSAGDIALVRQTNMQHERDDYNEGGDV